ncbi:glycosyltransferase family protein [Acetobacter sicerae]|uniref:glycosyltransferase family protein n=1 Tax=Acetobacter sicerae TaxID=85325 RepID=UPI00156BD8C4|nr:hypothetical protein [Acetobacter sicerae]NHN93816.1 hypothetical protein [Acetobacter sicerae]
MNEQKVSVLEEKICNLSKEKIHLLEMLADSVTVRNNLFLYRDRTKELTNMCRDRDREISTRDGLIHHLNSEIHHLNVHIQTISRLVDEKDIELATIRSSSSWKVTTPLRGVSVGTRKGITFSKLFARGRFGDIKSIIKSSRLTHNADATTALLASPSSVQIGSEASVTIIASKHTLFVAYILSSSLTSLGFDVSVMTEMPETFNSRFYFVVCAQMYDRLPPAERRICVQLEQSSMSRWFNEKYITCLKESLAVIEYSSAGLRFLDGLGVSYPKVFYARIGGIPDYLNYIKAYGVQIPATVKEYDVIFYGDTNNIRRQRILEAVSSRYNVKIIDDLFGEELYKEISKARVCLNIHYYDESALESTRIFEALSIGVPVVTETSPDISDYDFSLYGNSIAFADVGNADQIVSLIGQMIEQSVTVPLEANRQSGAGFHFYVSRLMMAIGAVDFRRVYSQSRRLTVSTPIIALSMPETFERRELLMSRISSDTYIFPGLRATPGWVGAACSFKYLAKKLLESGVEHALIFEDDAEFIGGMGPEEILAFAMRVKKTECDWDVFSAFISDLHCDTKISDVFDFETHECALLNRMVGMVCNVYSRKALELIAQWDEKNADLDTNTIDRYLEAFEDLRIVTTLPFLVGHSEMVSSSMWGVNNLYMKDMIASSSNLLFEKIWAFKVENIVRSYSADENTKKGSILQLRGANPRLKMR